MEDGRFGPYRLERLLGRGGMGQVWLARDAEGARVAVKLLPADLAADPAFRARFEREAAVAATLRDPHLLPLRRYGTIDGRLYIEMDHIDGVDLGTLLADGGPLDPATAVAMLGQVAAALDTAHRAGLVHRDVKPANILIRRDGFAYLIDFGIARGAGQSALTAAGSAIGTLAYMAPERFTGDCDARADIYSLACVLYETLTGRRPYGDTDPAQQMHRHLLAPPPGVSTVDPRIPAALDAVVARGMAKDPAARPTRAGAFAEAARHALGTPSATDGGAGTGAEVKPPTRVLTPAAHPGTRAYPVDGQPSTPGVGPDADGPEQGAAAVGPAAERGAVGPGSGAAGPGRARETHGAGPVQRGVGAPAGVGPDADEGISGAGPGRRSGGRGTGPDRDPRESGHGRDAARAGDVAGSRADGPRAVVAASDAPDAPKKPHFPTKVLPATGPSPTRVATRLAPRPVADRPAPTPRSAVPAPVYPVTPAPVIPAHPVRPVPRRWYARPRGPRWAPRPAPARPAPRRRRRGGLVSKTVAALVVIFLAPFACAAGCFALLATGGSGSVPDPAPVIVDRPEPEAAAGPAPAGTAVRDGKFEFVVTGTESGVSRVGVHQARGSYLVVELRVRNISDEGKWFLPFGQKLVDVAGDTLEHDAAATTWRTLGHGEGYSFELPPGESAVTHLVFDVPVEATPSYLRLHDFPLSGGISVHL